MKCDVIEVVGPDTIGSVPNLGSVYWKKLAATVRSRAGSLWCRKASEASRRGVRLDDYGSGCDDGAARCEFFRPYAVTFDFDGMGMTLRNGAHRR